jgi:hypothetical protein
VVGWSTARRTAGPPPGRHAGTAILPLARGCSHSPLYVCMTVKRSGVPRTGGETDEKFSHQTTVFTNSEDLA